MRRPELQSLALDIRVLTDKHEEIGLKDILDDDGDIDIGMEKEVEKQEVSLPDGDKGEDLFDFDEPDADIFGSLLGSDEDEEMPEGFSSFGGSADVEDDDFDDMPMTSGLFDGLFDEDADDTDAE